MAEFGYMHDAEEQLPDVIDDMVIRTDAGKLWYGWVNRDIIRWRVYQPILGEVQIDEGAIDSIMYDDTDHVTHWLPIAEFKAKYGFLPGQDGWSGDMSKMPTAGYVDWVDRLGQTHRHWPSPVPAGVLKLGGGFVGWRASQPASATASGYTVTGQFVYDPAINAYRAVFAPPTEPLVQEIERLTGIIARQEEQIKKFRGWVENAKEALDE
jgi:hypothetical protein